MDELVVDAWTNAARKTRNIAFRGYTTDHEVTTLEAEAEQLRSGAWERRGRSSRRTLGREHEESAMSRSPSSHIRTRDVSPVQEIFDLELTHPTTSPKQILPTGNSPKSTFQYTPPKPVHFPIHEPTELCPSCGKGVWLGALSVHLDVCSRRVSYARAQDDDRPATGEDSFLTTRRVMHLNAEAVVPNNDRVDIRAHRRRSQRAEEYHNDRPPAYSGPSYLNPQVTDYRESRGQRTDHQPRERGSRNNEYNNQSTSTVSPRYDQMQGDGRYFTPPRWPYLP
jgi:hypothetical protein